MKAMVGFRNIAIHDYRAINLKIIQVIIIDKENYEIQFL
jgi:uncharacterized protein YutE (UPF0331/DUF86 family)